jgi:hypothetical protein
MECQRSWWRSSAISDLSVINRFPALEWTKGSFHLCVAASMWIKIKTLYFFSFIWSWELRRSILLSRTNGRTSTYDMIAIALLLLSLFCIFRISLADQTIYLSRPPNSSTWEPYFTPVSITADIGERIHVVANISALLNSSSLGGASTVQHL